MAARDPDYIVVGAGSAGCVLAARLTEDPDVSVLLVEAGGPDRRFDWRIHMPAALAYPLADDRVNWAFRTDPEPHMDGRRMDCPRGRVLGGSSSINGMAYVRGHARDYDRWAREPGLEGWRYADCLPYFRAAERLDIGGDLHRGDSGPLRVTAGRMENPLHRAWVAAGVQAGYPATPDMNGAQQEGFGRMDMTVDRGRRWSAARAWLHPARRRPNLRVATRTRALRIAVERGRAIGVEIARGRRVETVRAGREVLLCAGAIGSPHLLLLSGIGPADESRRHGVAPVHDLPGVGANLQDHLEIYVQHACERPVSLYGARKPWRKLAIGAAWLLARRGIGATSHFESGGFIRSAAGVEHPDLQYHFLPVAMNYDGTLPHEGHGFQAHVGPMRPESRGRVRLASPDPAAAPSIRFDYMAAERDRAEMRVALRLTREIFRQPAFDGLRGPELSPGPDTQTDAGIDAFVRARAESAYHPCGTCAMGSGPMAVTDGAGRVRGLEGLRVVDASIMPGIPSGNLNAPTLMLAEKLADAIRGRPSLPPIDAPVWIHPEWETRQR